ncbi:MAG: hypothetical protein V1859_01280 [archaeon]
MKNNNNLGKKSQTEILGLAIVIVLLILGGLFIIGMNSRKTRDSDLVFSADVSQNILNAIVNTNSDSRLTLADCLRDVIESENKCKDGIHPSSLAYAHDAITKILEETLKKWGKNYEFTAKLSGDRELKSSLSNPPSDYGTFVPIINGGCGPEKERAAPGRIFIPGSDLIVVTLIVCEP